MEAALISKKELLQRYGISYGALYRWKRKGLIPEDWFVKKATVTGQETFFPEQLICQRVEQILEQKEECSLDGISKQLSNEHDRMLILRTPFGEKAFPLEQIDWVCYDDGDGNRRNITAELSALCRIDRL